MTGDYRIKIGFFRHHKTKRLKKKGGADAILALLQIWEWAAEQRPDGDLRGLSAEDIDIVVDWDSSMPLATLLSEAGFLDGDEGEYRLHDWAYHNPWVAESTQRSDAARLSRLARENPKAAKALRDEGRLGITEEEYHALKLCPNNDRSTTVVRPSTVRSTPAPAPAPDPAPDPEPKDKDQKQKTSPGLSPATTSAAPPPPIQPEDISCQAIVDLYHEVLPELPRVAMLTEARRKAMRSRWTSKAERRDLEWWRRYFLSVRQFGFLFGRNERNWTATFDFLIGQKGMAGILEGKYADRGGGRGGRSGGSASEYVDSIFPDKGPTIDAEVVHCDGWRQETVR